MRKTSTRPNDVWQFSLQRPSYRQYCNLKRSLYNDNDSERMITIVLKINIEDTICDEFLHENGGAGQALERCENL